MKEIILKQMRELAEEIQISIIKRQRFGRGLGEYVSPKDIREKERQFARLKKALKQHYPLN